MSKWNQFSLSLSLSLSLSITGTCMWFQLYSSLGFSTLIQVRMQSIHRTTIHLLDTIFRWVILKSAKFITTAFKVTLIFFVQSEVSNSFGYLKKKKKINIRVVKTHQIILFIRWKFLIHWLSSWSLCNSHVVHQFQVDKCLLECDLFWFLITRSFTVQYIYIYIYVFPLIDVHSFNSVHWNGNKSRCWRYCWEKKNAYLGSSCFK